MKNDNFLSKKSIAHCLIIQSSAFPTATSPTRLATKYEKHCYSTTVICIHLVNQTFQRIHLP